MLPFRIFLILLGLFFAVGGQNRLLTASAQPPCLQGHSGEAAVGELEALLRDFLGDEVDHYGIVVKPLGREGGVALNAEQGFPAASLYKLAVLYEVLRQREEGLLEFEETWELTPAYASHDLGTLPWAVGSTLTLGEAVEAMITLSDNASAIFLTERVGARNVNRSLTALGLNPVFLGGGVVVTTSGDMARLLELIALGEAVSPEASAEMRELLLAGKVRGVLRALLPDEAQVAHKHGLLDEVTHEVGIVYAPWGEYVIALLSAKPGNWAALAQLSRLSYEALAPAQEPPLAEPCEPPEAAEPGPLPS